MAPPPSSSGLEELLRKFRDKTITRSELRQLKHKLERKLNDVETTNNSNSDSSREMSVAEILMLGLVDASLAMQDKQMVDSGEEEKDEEETNNI